MKKHFAVVFLSSLLIAIIAIANTGISSIQSVPGPIAYGLIDSNGNIITATPNVIGAEFDSISGQYAVALEGINFVFSQFVTQVTVPFGLTEKPLIAMTNSSGGNLRVIVLDVAGDIAQSPFQFVIYQP
jgi:hypothetical protein